MLLFIKQLRASPIPMGWGGHSVFHLQAEAFCNKRGNSFTYLKLQPAEMCTSHHCIDTCSGLGEPDKKEDLQYKFCSKRFFSIWFKELWLFLWLTTAHPSPYISTNILTIFLWDRQVFQHWKQPSKESKLCQICDNTLLHSSSLRELSRRVKNSPNSLLAGIFMGTMKVCWGEWVWNWIPGYAPKLQIATYIAISQESSVELSVNRNGEKWKCMKRKKQSIFI